MESLEPEERIADEERPNFTPAVVEDVTLPVRMKSFSRVRVFKKKCSIKLKQAVRIAGEVGWNPVEDDPDPFLVKAIHQVHKVLGRPVPAGWSKVTCHLISP